MNYIPGFRRKHIRATSFLFAFLFQATFIFAAPWQIPAEKCQQIVMPQLQDKVVVAGTDVLADTTVIIPAGRAGYYKIHSLITYNSSQLQSNESFFILVEDQNGITRYPLDANASDGQLDANNNEQSYFVVEDDSAGVPGTPLLQESGTFYLSEGPNKIGLHHYDEIAARFPQFLNCGPIGDSNCNIDGSGNATINDVQSVHISQYVFVFQCMDLDITKNSSAPEVRTAESVTYTLNVQNNGPKPAYNISVVDTLPSLLTASNFVPPFTSNTDSIYSWTFDSIDSGATQTIQYLATMGTIPKDASVNLINRGTVSALNDTLSPNNRATALVTGLPIRPPAYDLTITKQVSSPAIWVGGRLSYTIEIENKGPNTAYDFSVRDTPGTVLALSGFSITPDAASTADTLVWLVDSLQTGQTMRIAYTATAPATIAQDPLTVSNTALIRSEADTLRGNDISTVNITVSNPFDYNSTCRFSLLQAYDGHTFSTGGTVTRDTTITIASGKAGYYKVHTWTLFDAAETNESFFIEVINANGQTQDPVDPNATIGNRNYAVVVDDAAAGNSMPERRESGIFYFSEGTNRVRLTHFSAISSSLPQLLNCSQVSDANCIVSNDGSVQINGQQSFTVLQYAFEFQCTDLELTRSIQPRSISSNGTASYSISVTNNGPNPVWNSTLLDTLPPTLTPSNFVPPFTEKNGTVYTWQLPFINSGESVTVQYNATVGTIPRGPVLQLISRSGVQNNNDTLLVNNAVADTILGLPPESFDLEVTKTSSAPSIQPGGRATYTIAVRNYGPGGVQDVILQDTPDRPALISNISPPPDQDISTPQTFSWRIPSIPNGATVEITYDITAPDNGRYSDVDITNFATLIAAGDAVVSNNAALSSIKFIGNTNNQRNCSTTTLSLRGNEKIVSTDLAGSDNTTIVIPPGKEGYYKLFASVNYNSSTEQSNENFYMLVVNQDGRVQYPQDANASDGRLDGNGVEQRYFIVEDDSLASADLPLEREAGIFYLSAGTNTIQVWHYSNIADRFPAFLNCSTVSDLNCDIAQNGSQSIKGLQSVRISQLVFEYQCLDASLTKDASLTNVESGDIVDYTLTINNAGPSTAWNVTVRDTLPGKLTAENFNPPFTTGAGNIYSWTFPSLESNQQRVITYSARVGDISNDATLSLINMGWVEIAGDTAQANNMASAIIAATAKSPPNYDLALSKTAEQAEVTTGSIFGYSLLIENLGPNAAGDFLVKDVPGPGLELLNFSPAPINGDQNADTLIWSFDTLAVGASIEIKYQARAPREIVASPTSAGNSSFLVAPNDTTEANNTAAVDVNVVIRQDCYLDRNVFRPSSESTLGINFELTKTSVVTIQIHDLSGTPVKKIAEQSFNIGPNRRLWDGRSENGNFVGSGLYIVTLRSADGSFKCWKKLMVVQ